MIYERGVKLLIHRSGDPREVVDAQLRHVALQIGQRLKTKIVRDLNDSLMPYKLLCLHWTGPTTITSYLVSPVVHS